MSVIRPRGQRHAASTKPYTSPFQEGAKFSARNRRSPSYAQNYAPTRGRRQSTALKAHSTCTQPSEESLSLQGTSKQPFQARTSFSQETNPAVPCDQDNDDSAAVDDDYDQYDVENEEPDGSDLELGREDAVRTKESLLVEQNSPRQCGTFFSKLVTERKIEFTNDCPKDNKIYNILSRDIRGSMYLLGYRKDLTAGLLESTVDELEVPVRDLEIDLTKNAPAINLLTLRPSQPQPQRKKKLKRYFIIDDVARFIVDHEVTRLQDRLSSKLLVKLAEDAATLFPRAGSKEMWYQQAITINHMPKQASGTLCRAMRELSKDGYNLGIFKGRSSSDDWDDDCVSETFEELKLAKEITPEVKAKWMSIQSEIEDFFSKAESIQEIFDTLPILRLEKGLKLLTDFFDEAYATSKDLFLKNWGVKAVLILEKAIQMSNTQVTEAMNDFGELTTYVAQVSLALLLMPLMMKPLKCVQTVAEKPVVQVLQENQQPHKQRKSSKVPIVKPAVEGWTATPKEEQESFVQHIEVVAQPDMTVDEVELLEQQKLKECRKALEELYAKFKLSLTAHIVVIGPWEAIKRSVLFIGDEQMVYDGADSLIRCVEDCFKAMTMLDKDYPKAASAAWEYLSEYVFKIPVPGLLQIPKKLDSFIKAQKVTSNTRARK